MPSFTYWRRATDANGRRFCTTRARLVARFRRPVVTADKLKLPGAGRPPSVTTTDASTPSRNPAPWGSTSTGGPASTPSPRSWASCPACLHELPPHARATPSPRHHLDVASRHVGRVQAMLAMGARSGCPPSARRPRTPRDSGSYQASVPAAVPPDRAHGRHARRGPGARRGGPIDEAIAAAPTDLPRTDRFVPHR